MSVNRQVNSFGLIRASIFALLVLNTAPALASLAASVTLTSGQPGTILPGQTTELQITLSNNNVEVAGISGVGFSNLLPGALPNGLKIAGAASYTCANASGPVATTGTVSATVGMQAIALAGGSIPARASNVDGTCTIVVPVTAGTSDGNSATYAYTILSGAVTGTDNSGSVANSGQVQQSINVSALAKPTIAKSFASSSLSLGGSATTLTLTLTNSNSVPIPNFSISDVFPSLGSGGAIIKVASLPNAISSCNNSGGSVSFSPLAGHTTISATGTIPARAGATNGTCTVSVQVEGAHTNGTYTTGTQSNSINASSQFANDIGIPAAANATANVTVNSPLRVTKAFSPAPLASGQSGVLTITLTNDGASPLTVTTFDDLPIDGIANSNASRGLLVSSVANTCGGTTSILSVSGIDRGVRLSGGTIPANSSCAVSANFTATTQADNTPVTYTNNLSVGAVQVSDPGVVSQSVSATILVSDTLRVLKANSASNPRPGNPARYTITVQNWSSSDMANVRVLDTLSNGMTFVTGTIGGNNYTPTSSCALSTTNVTGDSALSFTLTNVPQRSGVSSPGTCTVTFYAMTSTSAANNSSTVNSIAAGSVCTDGGSGICNGGAASSGNSTVNTSVLTAAKTFDGATTKTYPEGTISTLKITMSNFSANPLTGVAVSDTLPISGGGQLRIASPANAASDCGTPSITATPGSTSVAMNGGTVPARASGSGGIGAGAAGTCFVQVDVIGPAGVFPNTANVDGLETYANGTTHNIGTVVSSTATLTYTSSLSAAKSFNPAAVSTGGLSTVTVRLSNSSAVALTDVAVTDPLPAGMVLAPTPRAYTTCAGSTSVSAVAGVSSVSLTGANIAGFGNCDFVFDVVAAGASNWVNSIPAGNITANGGIRNVTPVAATLINQAPTNLTVAKATNPSTLTFPGQVSQLTLTISNGSQAVTGLRLTDYFTVDGTSAATANGMVVAAPTAASTTCPGGIVSAGVGSTSVALSGVSLAASASCTVSVNVTSTAIGGVTNFIPAGAIVTDQGQSNGGQATTSLTTQSNIGVTKQFTPSVVVPGERSRLRITFYNPTAQPVAALGVLDTLPSGVTVPDGPNPATTCTGATVSSPATNQVQVANGTIAAATSGTSGSCYAEIDVIASSQGDFNNVIAAGAVIGSSGGASVTNAQPASDTLRAKMPLTVHKAIDTRTLDSGNPAGFTTGTATTTPGLSKTLTVRLDNPNSVVLTGAAFTDSLPTGLVIATPPSATTTCAGGTVIAAAAGTSVRLAGASVPAGGSCIVSVDVLSNISGTYTNTIPAGGVTTVEGVSNAEPSSAALIVSTPPSIVKQFSPGVIPAGGRSTLTIVIGNQNASSITLSSILTDILPTAPNVVTVANPTNASTTCTGSVTAVSGGASVSLANGTTIPAGGCSISVDVTVPPTAVSGTNTNNIPAGTLQTSVGNNQAPANATLTVSALGYVSGRVFADNNVTPDGIYQLATDSPLTGVSLALYSGANCGGVLVGTTTTDSLGNYLFLGLAAGTYSVCQAAQPTGTVNGATSAGALVSNAGSTGTAGAAGNPTATSSQIAGIVLNGDGTDGAVSGSTNNNFAEIVPSSIAGTVYLDQNNNGVQNGADAGISGITIELLNSVGSVIQTTTTDANGNYRFAGLDPGTYSVREPTQPPATSNGITTPGSVSNGGTTGTASGITTAPSQISNIVLPPNTTASGNNFGEIPNGRSVSGQVFLDYNANGVNNGTPEHGIGGQTVTLTGNDINGNPVSATTVTDSDGSYRFTGLPEGSNYTVIQATQPAGTTNGLATAGSTGGSASNPTASSSQISGINLVGGNTVSANNDFAEVPGAAPDLAIAKTHSPASFAESGNTGFYTITPSNLGTVDTSGAISIVDTLPTGITLAATAIGNGWTCSGAAGASVVSCTTNAVIAAGSSGSTIILRVAVAAGLSGQVLTNTAVISGGSEPAGFDGNNTATDPVVIATAAAVQGHVWLDLSHSRRFSDAQSVPQAGWTVELKLNGNLVSSTTTDTAGAYAFNGLAPGSGYQIRFRHPTTGQIFGNARPNETDATYTSGVVDANNPAGAVTTDGTLKGLTFLSGTTTLEQSLPVDPAGVVYDAVTRQPVAGAVITIGGPPGFDPAVHLVGGNPAVTTGTDGLYQFLLAQGAPSGTYVLTTTTYPGGYMPSPSTMIPVCTASLAVGATPDPALVQTSNTPPGTGVTAHNPAACPGIPAGAVTTQYYSSFVITAGVSASVVNNHIPLDPILGGAIVMTKTTPMTTISKGGLIPYTVTATNTLSATLTNINIVDRIPPGFRYRSGSASLNGLVFEPTVSGRDLNWLNQTFTAGERKTIKMILVVGAGVGEGEYVNQAWSVNSIVSSLVSNVATATVRVIPDPTFDCSDIIGKVFDDKNANGYQDDGEPGIPNVRVVTARGLLVTADADGRFHVPCAAIPQIDHGSNFVMKLDERTLPSGYRLTTENPRDVRVTRGKMVKLNFGATVHRVVRLELTPTAFTVGDELDPQWVAKLDAVVEQLKGRPSVLRIAYAGVGDQSQVRVDRVAERIRMLWKNHEKEKDKKVALPPLIIETELEGAQ